MSASIESPSARNPLSNVHSNSIHNQEVSGADHPKQGRLQRWSNSWHHSSAGKSMVLGLLRVISWGLLIPIICEICKNESAHKADSQWKWGGSTRAEPRNGAGNNAGGVDGGAPGHASSSSVSGLQIPDGEMVVVQRLDEADFITAKIGSGGLGSAYKTTLNGMPAVVKFLNGTNQPVLELDRNNMALKPARVPEYTVAYMKDDVPGVVRPSHFLVSETGSNGVIKDLIVKGGPDFKGWVREQLTKVDESGAYSIKQNAPTLKIVGMIMPEATGMTLGSLYTDGGTLGPGVFSQLATSGMEVLQNMAGHGFVHGDIKPANIIADESGRISMIDTGSMAKISKKVDNKGLALREDRDFFDKKSRPTTPGYTHPGYPATPKRVGLEQDLFGMGVTLLETKLNGIAADLKSRGQEEEANEILDTATTILNEIADTEGSEESDSKAEDLKNFIQVQLDDLKIINNELFQDGELEWAMKCIGKALDQKSPVSDRLAWQRELDQLRNEIPSA